MFQYNIIYTLKIYFKIRQHLNTNYYKMYYYKNSKQLIFKIYVRNVIIKSLVLFKVIEERSYGWKQKYGICIKIVYDKFYQKIKKQKSISFFRFNVNCFKFQEIFFSLLQSTCCKNIQKRKIQKKRVFFIIKKLLI